jgi:hypothetical protein
MDESKLPDMSKAELLDVMRSHSPTSIIWQGAVAVLGLHNAKRMLESSQRVAESSNDIVESSRRIELATYVILAAAILQLTVTIIQVVRVH